MIICSCLHCMYWWSLNALYRQTTFLDLHANPWHHSTLNSIRLPGTHSATISTNLTAVFKSWGRIDLFLLSDGFKMAFNSCDIFRNTFLSLSVRSRLVPLDSPRLLIKSSVCKQRLGLAYILNKCTILKHHIIIMHNKLLYYVLLVCYGSITLFYLLLDCLASHWSTFRGINRAPHSRHASQTSPVG